MRREDKGTGAFPITTNTGMVVMLVGRRVKRRIEVTLGKVDMNFGGGEFL